MNFRTLASIHQLSFQIMASFQAISGNFFVVLRYRVKFNRSHGQLVKRGLALDVEATGLSLENDDVIQLAMLPFDYDPLDGRITDVHKDASFEEFREPALPISEEASIITGITDQMVSGKSIDEEQVQALVEQTDLIFAHNVYFDRVMVEKALAVFFRETLVLYLPIS